jgi:serine/threonine-protein kinase
VEISKTMEGTRIVLATPGEGAIIGELAGITQDVRTADVIAKEDTEVLIISHGLLMQELRKLPPWMERIVTTLAERLTSLNGVVHPFMIGSCALPVLTQLYYVFCFLNEKPTGKTKVSVKLEGLVHEVSLNLGITSDRVQKVLQTMLNTPLCTLDEFGRFKIIDMTAFREFLDYYGERQKRAAGAQLATTGQKEPANATFDQIVTRLEQP